MPITKLNFQEEFSIQSNSIFEIYRRQLKGNVQRIVVIFQNLVIFNFKFITRFWYCVMIF